MNIDYAQAISYKMQIESEMVQYLFGTFNKKNIGHYPDVEIKKLLRSIKVENSNENSSDIYFEFFGKKHLLHIFRDEEKDIINATLKVDDEYMIFSNDMLLYGYMNRIPGFTSISEARPYIYLNDSLEFLEDMGYSYDELKEMRDIDAFWKFGKMGLNPDGKRDSYLYYDYMKMDNQDINFSMLYGCYARKHIEITGPCEMFETEGGLLGAIDNTLDIYKGRIKTGSWIYYDDKKYGVDPYRDYVSEDYTEESKYRR